MARGRRTAGCRLEDSAVALPPWPAYAVCGAQQPRRWVQPLASSAASDAMVWAAQSRSLRASALGQRPHAQALAPPALAARLPPDSPRNQHRWSPGGRSRLCRSPGRGNPRSSRAGVEWRFRPQTSGRLRRSFGEAQSDRSLRGERRRPDGKATALRPCRAILSCSISECYAFGTFVRVWDCAGRSYPSHSASREVQRHDGSKARGTDTSRPSSPGQVGIGRMLVWLGAAERNCQSRHIRMVNARPSRRSSCLYIRDGR
jgi:hypothetical protein